ncbi:uncharacterized protein LOC107416837 [Ziziphus jujuba]|uniref:Uncharacterized protein LOC107416837 n=1 Tax=Ziziphus jujuba TaxID=326968 RepID=A0A6P3ZZ20_ZIZJJ|nr:uncharacterized protein LOC107416837 [Ziziphus jujuba]
MLVTEMEFRDYDDDAWYTVQVIVEGEGGDSSPPDSARLRVKFCGLEGQADAVFHASDLTKLSFDFISDFDSRFRTLSQQLQDSECSSVVTGMKVCASHIFNNDDLRFYDAIIEGVDYQKHSFENGEEECSCTFVLCWLHGPLAGQLTVEKIENICRIQSGEKRDSAVASFLKIVRKKIEIACNSNSLPGAEVTTGNTTDHHTEIAILRTEHRRKFSHHLKQETRVTRQPLNETQSSKWTIDYPSERTAQDRDFGGMSNHYLIFVENLEKELTPVQIVEFVRKEVSVSCQAFVFPSLSSELCARGNILVDSKKHFEKLCNFLDNPDQIIVSSRGRPWLITEKISTHDTLKASIGALVLKSEKIFQTTNIRTTNELKLKIVHSGTNEYRMAKQRRDLYKEFSDHQQRLQKRLFFEEEKILKL